MKRSMQALLLGSMIAAAPAGASGLPKDPCSLLKPEEIQALAPGAKIGPGKANAAAAPMSTMCTYTWGPRTREWGDSAVTLMVMDTTKAFAGRGPDIIVQGMQINAKRDPNGASIPGIGDAAVFTYEKRSYNGTADAFLKSKDAYVSVAYHGDSLANKDKVIRLLKAAVGRL